MLSSSGYFKIDTFDIYFYGASSLKAGIVNLFYLKLIREGKSIFAIQDRTIKHPNLRKYYKLIPLIYDIAQSDNRLNQQFNLQATYEFYDRDRFSGRSEGFQSAILTPSIVTFIGRNHMGPCTTCGRCKFIFLGEIRTLSEMETLKGIDHFWHPIV